MSSERAIGFSMLCWTMLMLTSITLLLQMQRPKPPMHSRAHRDWRWWSTRMSYANTKIKRKACGLPRPLPPRWPRWSGQFWMLPMELLTHGRGSGHVSKKALKRKNMKSWNFTCNNISSQLQWNYLMMGRFITGRSKECALTHFLTSLTWNTLLPGIRNQLYVPSGEPRSGLSMVAKCSKPSPKRILKGQDVNPFPGPKRNAASIGNDRHDKHLGTSFAPRKLLLMLLELWRPLWMFLFARAEWLVVLVTTCFTVGSLKMIVVSDTHRSDQQRLKETLCTGNFELSLLVHLITAHHSAPAKRHVELCPDRSSFASRRRDVGGSPCKF